VCGRSVTEIAELLHPGAPYRRLPPL
jgi:hypothetical protein